MLNTEQEENTWKNIAIALRDRQLNFPPECCTSNLFLHVIGSGTDLYQERWTKRFEEEISYKNGFLFFRNYKEYCSLNSTKDTSNREPSIFQLKNIDNKNILEAISYSGKIVRKTLEYICLCELKQCTCLSECLLSISDEAYLYRHLLANGSLVNEVYLNINNNYKLKCMLWDTYGERFSLNYEFIGPVSTPVPDAVSYLVVFTFPLQFFATMEIKRSVFGEYVHLAKLKDEHLIVEIDAGRYNPQEDSYYGVYNFDEFIRLGRLALYKLGDDYENGGKVGSYPLGLPVNFTYDKAPPLLYKVKSYQHKLFCFGGYPYSCAEMYASRCCDQRIVLTEVKTNTCVILDDGPLSYNYRIGKNSFMFHPDGSNRVILKMLNSITFYKFISEEHNRRIYKEIFFQFSSSDYFDVLSYDYDFHMDIFAILCKDSTQKKMLIKLYDNATGENFKTIELIWWHLSEYSEYSLHIHSCAMVIITNKTTVHLYPIQSLMTVVPSSSPNQSS